MVAHHAVHNRVERILFQYSADAQTICIERLFSRAAAGNVANDGAGYCYERRAVVGLWRYVTGTSDVLATSWKSGSWCPATLCRPARLGPQYSQDAANDGEAAFPRPPSAVGSC